MADHINARLSHALARKLIERLRKEGDVSLVNWANALKRELPEIETPHGKIIDHLRQALLPSTVAGRRRGDHDKYLWVAAQDIIKECGEEYHRVYGLENDELRQRVKDLEAELAEVTEAYTSRNT